MALAWLAESMKRRKRDLYLFGLALAFVLYVCVADLYDRPGSAELLKTPPPFDGPSHCLCEDENFCFPGSSDNSTGIVYGKKFDCALLAGVRRLRLTALDAENADDNHDVINGFWEPLIVTASSSNHFAELREFMRRLRRSFATNPVVLYNIGLSAAELGEAAQWCNVEVRHLNFSAYPEHVKDLMNYSFKLIIIDALQSASAFFYCDTSVYLRAGAEEALLEAVRGGRLPAFSTFPFTVHSVFATTHPGMYAYVPVSRRGAHLTELVSTAMLVVDGRYTRTVMKWWYLCAMTADCIAPPGAQVHCDLNRYRPDLHHTYMHCHRYDQAFWNLIRVNEWFGPKNLAFSMGLIDASNDSLTSEVVTKADKAYKAILKGVFKHAVQVKKNVVYKQVLKFDKCL